MFCYARCYLNAPPPGTLLIYQGLPQRLRQELDSPHRKSDLPPFVVLSTASDAFLGGPEVQRITRSCLEILLNRRIGISLSTRGEIPEDVIALLGRNAPLVRIFVPLVSLADDYTRRWEPLTALPSRRLFLIQRLLRVGIRPRIRLDPVIPFVNDRTEQLAEVLSSVAGLGLRSAVVSFLHLRPRVAEQIQREAPQGSWRLVVGGFPDLQVHPDRFHHLPAKQRASSLARIQRIAEERGVKVAACRCQNPGIPVASCPVTPQTLPRTQQQQVLFK